MFIEDHLDCCFHSSLEEVRARAGAGSGDACNSPGGRWGCSGQAAWWRMGEAPKGKRE